MGCNCKSKPEMSGVDASGDRKALYALLKGLLIIILLPLIIVLVIPFLIVHLLYNVIKGESLVIDLDFLARKKKQITDDEQQELQS